MSTFGNGSGNPSGAVAENVSRVSIRAPRTQESQAAPPVLDEVVAMPPFSADDPSVAEVEIKPDLSSGSKFSEQTAFFLAKMSSVVYDNESTARAFFQGDGTTPGLGYEHFYWFEVKSEVSSASLKDAIHDTEAYVAADDEVLVVVFRGTTEGSDWATNLNIRAVPVPDTWRVNTDRNINLRMHQGFFQGLDTVWRSSETGMLDVICRLFNEEGKSRKLFIAGHSLGGALATVAMTSLTFYKGLDVTALYTFGSPRVYDEGMAKFFDEKDNHGIRLKEKCFRIRNNNDIVTRIPTSPYVHVGTEIYLDRFGNISTASLMDRLLGRLRAVLRGELVDGISDHGGSEYVRLIKAVVIHSRESLATKALSVVADAAQKVIPDVIKPESAKIQQQQVEAAKTAAVKSALAEAS